MTPHPSDSKRRVSITISAIALIATLVMTGIAMASVKTAFEFWGSAFYWIMLGVFLVWIGAWIESARDGLPRKFGLDALLAFTAAVSVLRWVPMHYRLLSDEANLVNVSRAMFFEHNAFNVVQGIWESGRLIPLEMEVPNRPLLFSLLTHFLHFLTGYDATNAHRLNIGVLFALVLSTATWARRVGGIYAPLVATILLLSTPIVLLCATSAGFDLLALTLGWITVLAVGAWLRDPTPRRLLLTWSSALAFSHVRYESILIWAVLAIGLWPFRRTVIRDSMKYLPLYALTPLLLSPLLFQSAFKTQRTYNWDPQRATFGLEHFFRNIGHFFILLTQPLKVTGGFNVALLWALVPLAAWAAGRFLRPGVEANAAMDRELQKRALGARWIATVTIALFSILIFSHFMGTILWPSQLRFFLFLPLLASILPVIWIGSRATPRRSLQWAVVALVFGLTTLPRSFNLARAEAPDQLLAMTQLTRIAGDALGAAVSQDGQERSIVIFERPVVLISLGYSSIAYPFAAAHRADLLADLKSGHYLAIYLIQRMDPRSREVVGEDLSDLPNQREFLPPTPIGPDGLFRIQVITNGTSADAR